MKENYNYFCIFTFKKLKQCKAASFELERPTNNDIKEVNNGGGSRSEH